MEKFYLCWNYLINDLANSLYNVYSANKTTKELWKSQDLKYKIKDAGIKKFMVGQFLDYKKVNSKIVINQVQKIQVILHEIHAKGMTLSEAFQIVAIIEKLLLTWKDFKNSLKHKRKEMNAEELIVRLRIEEDNRVLKRKFHSKLMLRQMRWSMVKALSLRRRLIVGPIQDQNEEYPRSKNFKEGA